MAHRFVDHTAELELELSAPTKEGVLEEATLALAELLGGDGPPVGPRRRSELVVDATDDPALLAAWIDEVVFVCETDGMIPVGVERIEIGPSGAHGVVSFVSGPPPHVVKGATYHDLELRRDGARWRGRVVLDV